MNEPTHTPGPWTAVLDLCPTTQNRWLVEKRQDGWKTLIAVVYADPKHSGGPELQGTEEANTCLISAAPDLLEALNQTLSWLTSYPGEGALKAYEQACAAIAKAEGKV